MYDVLILDTAARGHVEADCIRHQNPDVGNIYVYPDKPLANDVVLFTGLPTFEELGKDWDKALELLTTVFAVDHPGLKTIASADVAIGADAHGKFTEKNMTVLAPTVEAAEIETSKIFMKKKAKELDVLTADFGIFTELEHIKDYAVAKEAAEEYPLVLKADGLAAGKGVKVCHDLEQFMQGLDEFEKAGWISDGKEVIVEEYLEGPEISLHAWCDGENYVMFPFAMQDHKTIYEDNQGPMTGGMGVISPAPGITPEDVEKLGKQFIKPFVDELNRMGRPFKGVMYPSIKLTSEGPKLLEINARLGDPEAPAVLPMLESNLLEILEACEQGRLKEIPKPKWRKGAAVCISLACKGYPETPEEGQGVVITGVEKARKKRGVKVFDYGVKEEDDEYKIASGRVLAVHAHARTLKRAKKRAYKAAEKIWFGSEKPQLRRDIGKVAISPQMQQRIGIMREKLAA